jgi:hypothetical protein
MGAIVPPDAGSYSYAGTGYAHPKPPTIAREVVIYGCTANVVQTLDYFRPIQQRSATGRF